jgi:hypothetical protein
LDHPLLEIDQLDLRRRVVQLLRSSYSSLEKGNIIFVCGGNKKKQMRMQFREYCRAHKPNYVIFLPEYAIKNIFSEVDDEQFDIADFERLIGELSHAIVIFPEAAGSYAEVGYFSAIGKLATKTVLSLNSAYQNSDSFISMGPAKKIGDQTIFNPIIQTDYKAPDFATIASRIERIPFSKKQKQLTVDRFDQLGEYELFCIIHQIFNLLRIATYTDMRFVARALFKTQLKEKRLKQITSILVGSKLLLEVGKFGHYYVTPGSKGLLSVLTGYKAEENTVKLAITELILRSNPAFQKIVKARRDVA